MLTFFLYFLFTLVVPCNILILNCSSPWLFQWFFFLMIVRVPKLHSNDIFCRVFAPSKLILTLTFMVKYFLSWSHLIFFWQNSFLNNNLVILRTLWSLRRRKKPVKPLFWLLSIVWHYGALVGLLREAVLFLLI